MIILLDSAVVLLGLIVFKDWAVPLYSWFTIFVYGKVVEMFQTENPNRAVFIVSKKTQEIKDLIIGKMGMRGTFLHGREYEGKEKEIIFTAERKDMPRLKDEIKEIDPSAFISTMHASKDSPRPGICNELKIRMKLKIVPIGERLQTDINFQFSTFNFNYFLSCRTLN